MRAHGRRLATTLTLAVAVLLLVAVALPSGVSASHDHDAATGQAAADGHGKSALSLRVKGDEAMKKRDYKLAATYFTEAIDADNDDAVNWYKRSVCHMVQGKTSSSISDLNQAIDRDPKFTQALSNRAKQLQQIGQLEDAIKDYQTLGSLGEDASEKLSEAHRCKRAWDAAQQNVAAGNDELAIDYLSATVECAPKASAVRIMRGETYLRLGQIDNAIADTTKAARFRPDLLDPVLLLAKLYYTQGELEHSLNNVRTCLQSDPDYKPCKEFYKGVKKFNKMWEKANAAAERNDLADASERYEKALEMEKENKIFRLRLYTSLCDVELRAKKYGHADDACSAALEIDDGHVDAYLKRGEARQGAERFKEALQDFSSASQKRPNDQGLKQKVEDARRKLKAANRKDYYKILDINKAASDKEIKKAYKKKARQWHPDKHPAGEERDKATEMFKDVAEAKDVLLDSNKRALFDRGEDPFQQGGGGGGGGGFHPFFRQGGGGGGGGQQHFHFSFG